MATNSLFPRRSTPEVPENTPETVAITDADETFDVLTSTTARAILAALYDEPGATSDIADRVGTSLQNVTYHLDRLAEVGLVEVVDTWYSSKGKEMDVYAPTNEPLVLLLGSPDMERAVEEVVDDLEAETPTPT